MGEALKSEVKMPVWMVGILIGLLTSILVYTSVYGQTRRQTDINTKAIEVLQEKKADKELLVLILDGNKRIEDKLDKHILSK